MDARGGAGPYGPQRHRHADAEQHTENGRCVALLQRVRRKPRRAPPGPLRPAGRPADRRPGRSLGRDRPCGRRPARGRLRSDVRVQRRRPRRRSARSGLDGAGPPPGHGVRPPGRLRPAFPGTARRPARSRVRDGANDRGHALRRHIPPPPRHPLRARALRRRPSGGCGPHPTARRRAVGAEPRAPHPGRDAGTAVPVLPRHGGRGVGALVAARPGADDVRSPGLWVRLRRALLDGDVPDQEHRGDPRLLRPHAGADPSGWPQRAPPVPASGGAASRAAVAA